MNLTIHNIWTRRLFIKLHNKNLKKTKMGFEDFLLLKDLKT